MGRGRAKAKQTKVARKLKYSTSGTDLDRLRAELGATSPPSSREDDDRESMARDAYDDVYDGEDDGEDDDAYDDLADRYAHYVDDYDDDEDGGQARSSGRH